MVSRMLKVACLAAVMTVMVVALAACDGGVKHTGGVAATMKGGQILEDDVTDFIQAYRDTNALNADDAWIVYLNSHDYTPETFRSDVIDYLVNMEAVRIAADEHGIQVSDEQVDAQIQSVKVQYGSDADWMTALRAAGYDEDSYRESVRNDLTNALLRSEVASMSELDEKTLVDYCNRYATQYAGMKRSSHILFNRGDEENARKVLDRIRSGQLAFDEAARTYSLDTSASQGGDVGWDMMNSFVSQYTNALDKLSKGQVSDLVYSNYGIHIIKCTDEFKPSGTITSSSQVPAELLTLVKSYAASEVQSYEYNEWLADFVESLDVQKNPMPEGVPYNVSMEKRP